MRKKVKRNGRYLTIKINQEESSVYNIDENDIIEITITKVIKKDDKRNR